MLIISILSIVFALAATVLAFIFIVPAKKRAKFRGFLRLLHDTLTFKFLIVEKILQALYIFTTAYVITYGFCFLFYAPRTGWYGSRTWMGGYGLLIMLLGPIMVRLAYEFIMMFILLIKNVIQINNKLKNENGKDSEDIFSTPSIPVAKRPAPRPQASFCRNCGSKVSPGEVFCPNCGMKVK